MTDVENWESIQRHGLLSCSALLDLFEVEASEKKKIEENQRKENYELYHPRFGKVVLRDQKPLDEKKLKPLLIDTTTNEFIKTLNGYVFFWVRKERLDTLLNARAYRKKSHIVLTIKSQPFISKYAEQICLSPINSGSVIFGVGKRGLNTFKSIKEYDYEAMKKKRRDDAIVELGVKHSVHNFEKYLITVEKRKGNEILEKLF